MNPISPELQSKIASWRLRAVDGTLTDAEMREAIIFLREGRVAAASAAARARSPAAKRVAAPSADSLLGELEDL